MMNISDPNCWSPLITFKILLKNIEDLMKTPLANESECGNNDIYQLYINNKKEFYKETKEWTQKYAISNK